MGPLTLVRAYGLQREDPTGEVVAAYRTASPDEGQATQWTEQWTRSWGRRFGKPQRGSRCSSKYKGVSRDKALGLWKASIRIDGLQVTLAGFRDERAAAGSYGAAAVEHFVPAARPNFSNHAIG